MPFEHGVEGNLVKPLIATGLPKFCFLSRSICPYKDPNHHLALLAQAFTEGWIRRARILQVVGIARRQLYFGRRWRIGWRGGWRCHCHRCCDGRSWRLRCCNANGRVGRRCGVCYGHQLRRRRKRWFHRFDLWCLRRRWWLRHGFGRWRLQQLAQYFCWNDVFDCSAHQS